MGVLVKIFIELFLQFRALPKECFGGEGEKNLFSEERKEARQKWVADHYSEHDYETLTKKALEKISAERAQYFLKHPDELAFLSYGRPFFDPNALPTMG